MSFFNVLYMYVIIPWERTYRAAILKPWTIGIGPDGADETKERNFICIFTGSHTLIH
jgi:hypothetical protein